MLLFAVVVVSLLVAAIAGEHQIKSMSLPPFTFKMLVSDDSVNMTEFHTHLLRVTENHLEREIKLALDIDLKVMVPGGEGIFRGVHLSATTRQSKYQYSTDPRDVMATKFTGEANFDEAAMRLLNEDMLDVIVEKALNGDSYWKLMHLFIEDPVLKKIATLDIGVDDSFTSPSLLSDEVFQERKNNDASVAMLALFSTIFFFSAAYLSYLGYKRYFRHPESCFPSSKGSDLTHEDNEHDDGTEEGNNAREAEEIFDDENTPPRELKNDSHKKKKKKRVKPDEKLVLPVTNLDSIQEGEEVDEFEDIHTSTVPSGSFLI
jgi:hypothetical protein